MDHDYKKLTFTYVCWLLPLVVANTVSQTGLDVWVCMFSSARYTISSKPSWPQSERGHICFTTNTSGVLTVTALVARWNLFTYLPITFIAAILFRQKICSVKRTLKCIARITYGRNVVIVTDALRKQSVTDLPGEDRRALTLVIGNLVNHIGRRHARLRAADRTRPDRARFVVPVVLRGFFNIYKKSNVATNEAGRKDNMNHSG